MSPMLRASVVAPAFRPGDAEDAQPQARVPRQTSPAQRWLQAPSTTPVIQEVIDLEQDGIVPPAAPPTAITSIEVTEALWQRCHDEVKARRARRDEPLDP